MNNEIPMWWLVLSGLFFAFNLILFGALTFLAFRLMELMKEISPKVNDLHGKVSALVIQIQEVTKKVDDVAQKVSASVNEVGGRAKGVVGSAELVAQSASRQFERFSPFVVGAITAMRLVRGLSDIKNGRRAKDAFKKKNMKRKPAKGPLRFFGR